MDISDLIMQLKSENIKEKGAAISQLSRIAFRNPDDVIPAIPHFGEGLTSSSNEIVYRSAWAVGQVAHKRADWVNSFVPTLVTLFQHPDTKTLPCSMGCWQNRPREWFKCRRIYG